MPNTHVLQIPGLGLPELLALLIVVVILIFGARKIPEVAKSLGRARGEFEKGKLEVDKEIKVAQKGTVESNDRERERLEKAAKALGIDVEGKSTEELREAIRKAP